ncbi:MAG: phosphoribosylformylglycinamidine synthase subunit PurQ [Sphingomonadaceae bacterium]|nr:phosphoribosylformylglycinamidine synthase subunit PurQ [Sphingomonadaceae bacterium]
MKPNVLVLRAAGTNCDAETAHAFSLVGGQPTVLHVNRLRERPATLREHQCLAIPGGFSYGDDVASGRIFANELMSALRDELLGFVEAFRPALDGNIRLCVGNAPHNRFATVE